MENHIRYDLESYTEIICEIIIYGRIIYGILVFNNYLRDYLPYMVDHIWLPTYG